MSKPFKIRAAGQRGTTEILIYGDIGDSWSDESVQAADFVRDLQQIQADVLNVRINSYGGAVSDGIAIYNALRRHPAKVNVEIDGVAVSIASLIAMAGDTISMAENALMMIHAPWGAAAGNSKDMREMAAMLDKFADAMTSAYAGRLGTDTTKQWLSDGEDHWLTAPEAHEQGLIDEIGAPLDIAASLPPKQRFTIPEAMMPKTDPNKSDPNLVKQAEGNVLALIQARNNELLPIFAMHAGKPGMSELKDKVLGDPSITTDQARAMMLDELGKGVEPLNHAVSQGSTAWGENGHHTDFKDAAVDAMLLRAGISVNEPHPAASDLRGRSVLAIAETMIGHRGSTFLHGASPSQIVQAAMTTSDFPDLLSGVAGKSLMIGYENEPASHRRWTRSVEVDDFKPVTRVAISEAPELLEILEHGAYREGSLSDRAESYKLKTYGRIMKLTRQAIINDDLGGFTRIPMAFGASAARLEADKVYELLANNPNMSDGHALFSAEHGNLAANGSSLSLETLSAGRVSMRTQKGPNGAYLNIIPRYLIVPATMESEALAFLSNEHFERVVDGDTVRSKLTWVRDIELVVDPRLEAEPHAWYLAGGIEQIDTVEVAHLDGWKNVFTEDRQRFEDGSYEVKATLDFACQAIDWVGLFKNPGA
ncbi:MAG: ATP-dependent Clp protease proteolytic subunit [Candidatus Thiodiazotropha lotti]|nr:ATP-dependent Clp protease proteolytic subunit [Candidatus Thiodiazotropha lotti]MCW4195564.1 ATP-dependent Clp protease proteolytic subunit [Candidatus Thiodiazotropha lotti]